eukprot:6582551-Karenia_brevis.AAC.1
MDSHLAAAAAHKISKNERHRHAARRQRLLIASLREKVVQLEQQLALHAATAGHTSPVHLNPGADVFYPSDFNSQNLDTQCGQHSQDLNSKDLEQTQCGHFAQDFNLQNF